MVRRSIAVLFVSMSLVAGAALPSSAGTRVPRFATKGPFGDAAPVARAVAGDGFAISREDGNDTKGPLDLGSMTITRGEKNDTLQFSARSSVSNKAINPKNGNFAILIDRNDNGKYDFGQYVFFAAGKIRGLLVNLQTNRVVDRTAPTSRVNGTTFRTVIQRGRINSPGTYRFGVFSYYQSSPCSGRHPCIDGIPNRYPLIALDHKHPTISSLSAPYYSVDVSTTLTFPVSFKLADDRYGTGIQGWILEESQDGVTWTTVGTGTGSGQQMVDVEGIEGSSLSYRVIVTDKQENERMSGTTHTFVPFDDDSAALNLLYSSGDWSDDSMGTSFLGTDKLSVNVSSIGDGVTISGSFTGTSICFVGGDPTADGGAMVDVEGVFNTTFDEDPNTGTQVVGCTTAWPSGTHPFLLTVTGGVVSIDGFVVVG
jgi:hypothetical protein